MSQPDLFVVCKNCGSEVSPYVTECPYCGQRVRKRAPKLERQGDEVEAKRRRRVRPRLSRLREDEIEGIAPDSRPVATLALIVGSLLVTLALASEELNLVEVGGLFVGFEDDTWRWVTSPFVHDSLAYQFVTLAAIGVFGTMLERRYGAIALVLVFLLAGVAGSAAAVAADLPPLFESGALSSALGANGAALGLLFAWLVDDRRAAARGDDRENDLMGVWVFAAVLALMPLAVEEASVVAGAAGALTGALLAYVLPLVTRR